MLVTGATGAVFVSIAQSCGGQITVGYDDAGRYHTADGAVWTYGGGCVGFDASAYLVEGGPSCDASDQGTQWCTEQIVPPSLGQGLVSSCSGGACGTAQIKSDAAPAYEFFPPCGPPGFRGAPDPATKQAADEFCQAFYDQFVTHGHVIAQCSGLGSVYPLCGHDPVS